MEESEDAPAPHPRQRLPRRVPIADRAARRSPAAIVGIGLVVSLSLLFFEGVQGLPAQLQEKDADRTEESSTPMNVADSLSVPAPLSGEAEEIAPEPLSDPPPAIPESAETPIPPPSQEDRIPRNPYSIGSTVTGPGDRPLFSSRLHPGASGRPLRQPETGPEAWIVAALSAGALMIVLRKQLRSL